MTEKASNPPGVNWPFIAAELTLHAGAAASLYSNFFYHVTRFNRNALLDLPLGEFMTKHAGNMGPSVDIALFGVLGSGYLTNIGETHEGKWWAKAAEITGKYLVPTLTIAAIYWTNYLSESMLHPNPEGPLDLKAGMIVGSICLGSFIGLMNRRRHRPPAS